MAEHWASFSKVVGLTLAVVRNIFQLALCGYELRVDHKHNLIIIRTQILCMHAYKESHVSGHLYTSLILFSRIILLVYYCKCSNLVGYTTCYIFLDKWRVTIMPEISIRKIP